MRSPVRVVLFLQLLWLRVLSVSRGSGVVGASSSPSGVYALSGFVVHRVCVD